jgi:phospholipase/carboxylesterase
MYNIYIFNMDIQLLNGPVVYKHEGQKPTDLVVFLHGYGSCGKDLITLSKHIEEAFERPYFIAPNAPFAYEFVGATFPDEWQWYSLLDRSSEALMKGSKTAEPILNYFLDAKLEELNLTNQNLHIIGFSQGTMMALHTILRRKDGGCKNLVAFSGTMAGPEHLEREIISKPKVCFIHGSQDNIVPISLGKIAYNFVVENGVKAEFHKVENLEHYVNFEAIEIAKNFLTIK